MWRSLLTQLGVPMAKCKAVYEESRGNPVSACFEGLVFWREGNEPCRPPTWSVLLEALEKGAEKREYAERLREALIGSSNISQSKFDHMKISVLSAGTSTSIARMHDLSHRILQLYSVEDKFKFSDSPTKQPFLFSGYGYRTNTGTPVLYPL